MTTNAQVSHWLQLALQQIAAESYLHGMPNGINFRDDLIERLKFGFNDPTHPYISTIADPANGGNGADTPYLPGANRMPAGLAEKFVDRYEIVEQFSNNAFGFSATVIRDRTTGQYTLSFKSLEFPNWTEGGDSQRDLWGAAVEIGAKDGFAVGQAAAMEEYYQRLRAPGGALAAAGRINVTGYSLGGHLATLFTLLHESDVIQAITFNGAGHVSGNPKLPTSDN